MSESECCDTPNAPSDQKASNNAVPATVESHKHPTMQPIAGKCMQGANIK